MRPLIVDGSSLTLTQLEAVASARIPVQLADSGEAAARVHASWDMVERLVASGRPVYGVTTGPGHAVTTHVGADRARSMQANFMSFLGCGAGEALPVEACRASVLARVNCLARGYSGVRPELVQRLVDLLNRDIVPRIPSMGSVGASGDLVPSSYVAAVVMGRREVYHEGRIRPTEEVYQEVGLDPMTLEPKEGLALVNGTSVMTGIAVLATEAARRLARVADICTALTTEAMTGVRGPFDGFLHEVAKTHPGQATSARHVRALLEGGTLARDYDRLVSGLEPLTEGQRHLEVAIQDAYSVRCAPQCIGALYDTLTWIRRTLEIELNSSNDNPLFNSDEERVHSGGNFSGFHVGLAMDTLKTAVASVADLLDRQFALVSDEKYNRGLGVCCRHPFAEDDPECGIHFGFKGMQLVVSAVTAEALQACTPMTTFSRSTASHNQDKVSMATIAARQAGRVVDLTQRVAAMHLLLLAQAVDLRGAERMAPGTRRIYERVREVSPYVEHDRELEEDVGRVAELVSSGELAALVQDGDTDPGYP